jgi:hypothetical protein
LEPKCGTTVVLKGKLHVSYVDVAAAVKFHLIVQYCRVNASFFITYFVFLMICIFKIFEDDSLDAEKRGTLAHVLN